MSVVVAVRRRGEVVIGADSGVFSGWSKNTTANGSHKLWRHGDYLVGHTGSPRDAGLVQYGAPWPHPMGIDLPTHVHQVIVPIVRSAIQGGGAMKKTEEADKIGSSFLCVFDGQMFTIYGDFQVGFEAEPYAAIGGGWDHAYGALAALDIAAPQFDAESTVLAALAATERHYAGCVRPWVILKNQPHPGQTA